MWDGQQHEIMSGSDANFKPDRRPLGLSPKLVGSVSIPGTSSGKSRVECPTRDDASGKIGLYLLDFGCFCIVGSVQAFNGGMPTSTFQHKINLIYFAFQWRSPRCAALNFLGFLRYIIGGVLR